jgi:hypothetical protein
MQASLWAVAAFGMTRVCCLQRHGMMQREVGCVCVCHTVLCVLSSLLIALSHNTDTPRIALVVAGLTDSAFTQLQALVSE